MIHASAKYFMFQNLKSYVGLALVSSVLWQLFHLLILYFLGILGEQWRHTLALMFPSAAIAGITSIFIFRFYEKLDWITFKNPKAKHAQDELILDSEGWVE